MLFKLFIFINYISLANFIIYNKTFLLFYITKGLWYLYLTVNVNQLQILFHFECEVGHHFNVNCFVLKQAHTLYKINIIFLLLISSLNGWITIKSIIHLKCSFYNMLHCNTQFDDYIYQNLSTIVFLTTHINLSLSKYYQYNYCC